ncbi:MAG TPA: CHAT domain-containing protein [Thermoanaerobaculia bacterium]|nr:CHAT domain-containing protein [Thermoanaerobaculia bacterium]
MTASGIASLSPLNVPAVRIGSHNADAWDILVSSERIEPSGSESQRHESAECRANSAGTRLRCCSFCPSMVTTLLALLLFSVPPDAAINDAARQYLVLAYDGNSALPRSEDTRTEAFDRKVRNVLRTRCVDIEEILFRDMKPNGDAVEVLVDLSIRKTERDRQDPWVGFELIPLRMNLRREKNAWVVRSIEFLDQELATQLIDGGAVKDFPEAIPPSRLPGVARAIYEQSLGLLNAGKLDAAREAAALAHRIAAVAGDRGGEALALGVMMYAVTDRDEALAARLSEESVAIAESVGDPDVLARAWYNRSRRSGSRLTRENTPERDRTESWRRAIAYAERAEDPTLLLRVLYTIANASANVRDHLTARRHIDRILPLAREIGDVTGELSAESVLSQIYFDQGDIERGFYHNARARNLAEKRNAYAHTALTLRAGWVLVEERRYDEAREMFARVLKRDDHGQFVTRGISPAHLAATFLSMATMEAHAGHFDEADCLLRESARIVSLPASSLHHYLAPAYLQRREYHAALRVALESLAQPELFDYERVNALHSVATAYHALGSCHLGAEAVLEAIEVREALDLRVAGDEQQQARGSDRTARLYTLAADIALDLGSPADALRYLERGRARVLRDVLENGRPGVIASGETADADVRLEREQELARLAIEVERARSANTPASIKEAVDRLALARAAHATFLDGLHARSGRRALASSSLNASLPVMLQQLPAGMVALSYYASEKDLHVFVARRNATEVVYRKIAVDRNVLTDRIDRFVSALTRRDGGFGDSAAAVYQLLIGPVENDIRGAEGLVVIPDGPLWRVPFAALMDQRNRFLIERCPIVYAPSITAYSLMSRETHRSKRPARSYLGVGNPTLDEVTQTAFKNFYRNATLADLPDGQREVDSAGAFYRDSVVLTGHDANEGRVKDAIRDADVVHFATHALLDDRNPLYSRLALARDDSGHEDGWLETWEIVLLRLDADLVVLSACDTATGRIGAGEGVVGMAWSFFIAGARATVATQWKVSSRSSANLMIAFHESLKTTPAGSLRKAAALRDAQLRVMRELQYRHPFYWAAFVVLGDAS